MIFNTWSYALFLAAVATLHWLLPQAVRPALLLAAGAFFYGHYYLPHLPIMLATIPLVWGLAHLVARDARDQRRTWLTLGIVAALGALGWAKYVGLLGDTLRAMGLVTTIGATPPRAPLGISFFVFEYVHYLVDVGRGQIAPASLRQLGLFALFFPTLICGPIKRFQHFHPDDDRRWPAPDAVHEGLQRILFGVAKKALVADALAPWCAPVFTQPEAYGRLGLWLGVYAYAVQIYFDFSGYSDIAIGSARLLGYRVPENFAAPYRQPNVAAFWRAWHMSLTSWITDYVYVPLGGNRHGPWRAAGNRLVAMGLCGLWHGASGHFVVWGLYHGVALNLYQGWRALRPTAAPATGWRRWAATALTFHVVCLGWVLFATDLHHARSIIPRLLGIR